MSREAGGERVCFIRMNYFPEEAHVRKNAEALTEAGYDVDIICLRQKGEKAREDRGRVERTEGEALKRLHPIQ